MTMQMGIISFLRSLAVRCNQLAEQSTDAKVRESIGAIGVELTEKAEALDVAVRSSKDRQ